jgi:hypothetical protein
MEGPHYFLTSHGTLLSFDDQATQLVHTPLIHNMRSVDPLAIVCSSSATFSLENAINAIGHSLNKLPIGQSIRIDPGLFPSSLAFKVAENRYIAATENLSVKIENEITGSASFLLINEEARQSLKALLSNDWIIQGSKLRISKRQIAFGPNFTIYIGSFRIDLIETLSSSKFNSVDRLNPFVYGSTDEHITVEKATPLSAAPKTIWIEPAGNMGNRALQYLVAEEIRRFIPDALIENPSMPEWGRDSRTQPPNTATSCSVRNFFWIDARGLAECLKNDIIDSVIVGGFPYNLDNLPSRAIAKKLIGPTIEGTDAKGFGKHELVCSVRADEILTGLHPDYVLLPPSYYRMLAERTGLELVFFGQIGEESYSKSLREAFPKARFVAGKNSQYDFDMLRRSVNIAISVSTFSWLAAWVSDAEIVYVPVAGLFSPTQNPCQFYLPIDDESYKFVLFPFNRAADLYNEPDVFQERQDQLSRDACFVTKEELHSIYQRSLLFSPLGPYVSKFNPILYLARNPEAAEEVCSGRASALQHYYNSGTYFDRKAISFDPDFYIKTYPEVAMEVARGHYQTPFHHYKTIGAKLNYRTNHRM